MLVDDIYIVKCGDIMVFEKDGFFYSGFVFVGDVMIDGNVIGDVGNIVFCDCKVLFEDGIFIVVIIVSKKEKKIIFKVCVNMCGFVYVKKSRDILCESVELVNIMVEDYLSKDIFDWGEFKGKVCDEVSKFLFD